jgi:hypothetical protein
MWVADGPSVAAYDRGAVYVDGTFQVGDAPPISTIYGGMGYARSGRRGIAALATGNGMFAATFESEEEGRWTAIETRFPAGSPVAHIHGRHRGLFFVEGAIGFNPARLRWVPL